MSYGNTERGHVILLGINFRLVRVENLKLCNKLFNVMRRADVYLAQIFSPPHYWHFGPDNSFGEGKAGVQRSVRCRVFHRTHGSFPLVPTAPPHLGSDNEKCLRTLPSIFRETKPPPAEDHSTRRWVYSPLIEGKAQIMTTCELM